MSLKRELGLFGATMMGLGSIIGTGVFVSIGIAVDVAGPAVIVAIILAATVATCNALSSAQLAANHPVSGGTYEYGYRYLNPLLGFVAGWMFLCAKTASAATAALGFVGYLLNALDSNGLPLAPIAAAVVATLTFVVLAGIRLSNWVNIAVVCTTLFALLSFIIAGSREVAASRLTIDWQIGPLLHATALMFVAFTGYGRIATLGEEVVEPRLTIPRAIITTLIISALIYVGVAIVGVGAAGVEIFAESATQKAAPLEIVAQTFSLPVSGIVAVGAMTAMLGVLLNLMLGLSRVLLAMGRRGDMPHATSNLNVSTVAIGCTIALLTLTGNVKTTWSFSAFTVLIYYAVTNLAALQLKSDERLYGRAWAWGGLLACLALAFAIEWQVWASGLAILVVGVLYHYIRDHLKWR